MAGRPGPLSRLVVQRPTSSPIAFDINNVNDARRAHEVLRADDLRLHAEKLNRQLKQQIETSRENWKKTIDQAVKAGPKKAASVRGATTSMRADRRGTAIERHARAIRKHHPYHRSRSSTLALAAAVRIRLNADVAGHRLDPDDLITVRAIIGHLKKRGLK